MANTNLYQSGDQPSFSPKRGVQLDKGMLFSGILMLVVLALFGGVKMYYNLVFKEKTDIESKIDQASANLKSPEASEVSDFQKRLEKIDENLSTKQNPVEVLNFIEKVIAPEVLLASLSLDNETGTLELIFNVDNFRSMSRQIFIIKQDSFLSNVSVSGVERDEKGTISFLVSGQISKNESEKTEDESASN
jgi:Tfp pilus assembly protein PilN